MTDEGFTYVDWLNEAAAYREAGDFENAKRCDEIARELKPKPHSSSIAFGYDAVASGTNSIAIDRTAYATGTTAVALHFKFDDEEIMKVKVLLEAGYQPALYGMSLSHSLGSEYGQTTEKQVTRSLKLSHKQGGHNKFLESIMVWLEVTAPRYWWQQADTYRISTKQSESTMHTLTKHALGQESFAHAVPTPWLRSLNELIDAGDWETAKALLPESFLQKRVWLVSYKTLQNIFYQRMNHRLPEWQDFIRQVNAQVEHPEFLVYYGMK